MLSRIALVLFYTFFVGYGAPTGNDLLTHLFEHQQLNSVCQQHSCNCSFKGFCDTNCCCLESLTKEAPDRPTLASCGSSNIELEYSELNLPHLVPGTLCIPKPPLQAVSWNTFEPSWNDHQPLVPQKIPITANRSI